MSERLARVALGVVTGLALLAAVAIDLPRRVRRALLERRRDVPRDGGEPRLRRGPRVLAPRTSPACARRTPGGPRASSSSGSRVGSGTPRLVYAKALVYPAAAAPLARLLRRRPRPAAPERARLRPRPVAGLRGAAPRVGGGSGGRGSARRAGRRRRARLPALGDAGDLQPGARDAAASWPGGAGDGSWPRVLLGLAAYSKPTNLALALPLLLEPLSPGGAAGRWAKRAVESARRGAVVAAVVAAGFGLTWLATGELELPGRRAQDLLRPLPLRPRRHLRLRRRVDDDRPPGPARRRPRRGRADARASRRRGPPRSCGGPSC